MSGELTWKDKRVVVTGGAGFIGGTLAGHLADAGARVTVLDIRAGADPRIDYQKIDILDGRAVEVALADVDTVFHLAARVADWGRKAWFERVTVNGTKSVLQAARNAGCRRFVQMSSVAVLDYRRGWDDAPEAETYDGPPMGWYGWAKRVAEQTVRGAHGNGIETTIIRPGLVPFGPHDFTSFFPLVEAIEKRIPTLLNGGRAVFGTAYVSELVRGVALAGAHPAGAGEIFHIADDTRIDWRQWVEGIARRLEIRPNLTSFPRWLVAPVAWVVEHAAAASGWRFAPALTGYRLATATNNLHFSPAKAQRLLGFKASVPLDEALDAAVGWYRRARSEMAEKEAA